MHSNFHRSIHSGLLAATLLFTTSTAHADGRRFKGVSDAYPVQRVIVREHSSAAPAMAALIGGFILGSAITANAHPVFVHEVPVYHHPVAMYRYYDPYNEVWYDSLDECQFRPYHPVVVQVIDVRSGRHVRSLRFYEGGWHRYYDEGCDRD